MTPKQLRDLLHGLGDLQVHVLPTPVVHVDDVRRSVWACEAAAAAGAYAAWRRARDGDSYATYRALADRADAAQDALAAHARSDR